MIDETRRAHIGDVRSRWLNNHRYRSLAGLRRFLNEAELYRLPNNQFIKGDVVKYNWNVLLDSSLWLLSWGIERWNNSKHGLRL